MREQAPTDNSILGYGNLAVSILLIVVMCIGIRPLTIAGGIVLLLAVAYNAVVVINGRRCHAAAPLWMEMLGTPGRHPVLALALFWAGGVYSYLWSDTPAVVGLLLQCAWVMVLTCAVLRILELLGVRLRGADVHVVAAIEDLYWDHIQFVDTFYYVVFTVAVTIEILNATMLPRMTLNNWNMNAVIAEIARNLLLLLALLRFWDDKDRAMTLFQCAALVVGGMVWFVNGSTVPLVTVLLMLAAEGVSGKRLLQIYLAVTVIMLTIAAWASSNGYIYYYYSGGWHAMGIYYRTDFATYWLYVLILYRIMRGSRLHFPEYVGGVCLMLYIDHLTRGRTSLVSAALFLVLCFLVDYLPWPRGWTLQRVLCRLGMVVYPLAAMFSYFMAFYYGPAMAEIDIDTSTFWGSTQARIDLSYRAFQTYPLQLFSEGIAEVGTDIWGETAGEYFFLDNSYVRLLFVYGIAFLVLLLAIHVYLTYRCDRDHNLIMLCALVAIAVHSLYEPHLISIYHNVLPVLAYAVWDMNEPGTSGLQTWLQQMTHRGKRSVDETA